MIFAQGMSQENIDLVTKSNLFGQLVTTTKVHEDHEIKYYDIFHMVLLHCGWVTEHF